MGRQIAILLAERDEVGLLEFLRSDGLLRIFESFADSIDALEVQALPARAAGHLFFESCFEQCFKIVQFHVHFFRLQIFFTAFA